MNHQSYTKWVACWGNATSIIDQRECVYAKNITLRYPVRVVFSGSKLRLRFSNLTGTEPITINKVFVSKSGIFTPVFFSGEPSVTINPGKELESDETAIDITAGETLEVSMYLKDCTQMNSGTLITGPLSHGKFAYGDFADKAELPLDLTRNTNWFYFLNTIDILTEEKNHAIICYGDSITAQSWPDYFAIKAWEEGKHDVAIIRRAVSGTRILRQYDCITYAAYGLKGATRFPIEMNVAGATDVIIQHGINDIIHPVGTDVNPFRPWSDLPTVEEMEQAVKDIYLSYARKLGLNVWSGTLLPIEGWRTYTPMREKMKNDFNQWLRDNSLTPHPSSLNPNPSSLNPKPSPLTPHPSSLFAGCIDFDLTVRDKNNPAAFAPGFDSGDHLHPSEKAYEAMGNAAFETIVK